MACGTRVGSLSVARPTRSMSDPGWITMVYCARVRESATMSSAVAPHGQSASGITEEARAQTPELTCFLRCDF
eukprot:154443-Rhodomonas_salina.1